MVNLTAADGQTSFFFLGNCQLQFYARHFAKFFPGQVVCWGRAQVPFDCEPPTFVHGHEFFREMGTRKAAGGVNMLILQETSLGQFTRWLTPGLAARFHTIERIPYVHFRSPWPNFQLKVAGRFTPRSVGRLFAAERDEFEATLGRCGGSGFDAEAYWQTALRDLVFYHPGHPNGPLLLTLYDAFLHRPLTGASDKASEVRWAIAQSSGLPLTSLHPIEPEWGDAVGCEWHRRPAYQAWTLLKNAGCLEEVRAAEGGKQALSREYDRYAGALFRKDLASHYMRFGDLSAVAENSAEAAALLPGQLDILTTALVANARIGAWSAVEATLSANLNYLHPGAALAARVATWLRQFARYSEPLEILHRLVESAPQTRWLARMAEDALAPDAT